MKKKITLFLTLILALVAMFSIGAITASAEGNGIIDITVKDVSVVKGTETVDIEYEMKSKDGREIQHEHIDVEVEGGYVYKFCVNLDLYIELYEEDWTTKLANATLGTIKTKDMKVGEKTVIAKFYDKEGGILFDEATFKLTITKNDNTTTIIMIVLIVGIVGYMIWSNISNKKKQKKAQEKAGTLKIGDRVKTIGGVCGFVTEINDAENTFTLEVGENSFVKFDKGAIYQSAPAGGNAKEEAKEEKTETKEENK